MIKTDFVEPNQYKNGKSCTICNEISDLTHLYRCNMGGHSMCCSCFIKQRKNGIKYSLFYILALKIKSSGDVRCIKCNSIVLKIRSSQINLNEDPKKTITIEELFRLPSDQLNVLFNKNSREKLQGNDDTDLLDKMKRSQKSNHLQTWKPLKCPHQLCGKTVNSSSLKVHFMYEHSNVPTYQITRGQELYVTTNLSKIEHGISNCIGMIELYDEYRFISRVCNGNYRKDNQRISIGTFWFLLSGSEEVGANKSFALFWLCSDSEGPFKATLEASSYFNNSSSATFCGVNDVRDDLSIKMVMENMNCLYLCYGSLLNLKAPCGELNLTITIH